MLSVNPDLTAAQVEQILRGTADQNLDPVLDLAADPNLQGISGAFVNGRSPLFGSGKVNALRAVERARALRGPSLPVPAVGLECEEASHEEAEQPPVFWDEDGAGFGLERAVAAQPAWNSLPARHLRARPGAVRGIVLHDTAGSGTHNDTIYLANPSDGRVVSADFTVERNGSIWKLNPQLTQFCCLHAGRATRWRGLRNHQVNQATVGIEIVQTANLSLSPLYPRAQVRAVARLCAWLVTRFGLDAADITTHRAVITDGSRSDPRQFPFDGADGFWFFFREALGQAGPFLSSLMAATGVEAEEFLPQDLEGEAPELVSGNVGYTGM
jgi:hypothetical protein